MVCSRLAMNRLQSNCPAQRANQYCLVEHGLQERTSFYNLTYIYIYIFGMYVLLQLVQLAIKACAALSVAVQSGPADDFPSQKLDGCKPMRVSYYLDEFHDLHLSTD